MKDRVKLRNHQKNQRSFDSEIFQKKKKKLELDRRSSLISDFKEKPKKLEFIEKKIYWLTTHPILVKIGIGFFF